MVERPLRILQVSTADKQGGAERVAWNLFTGYRMQGHDSWLAVGVKHSNDPDVLVIPNLERRGDWHHLFHNISLRLQKEEKEGSRGAKPLSRLADIIAEPARRLNTYRGVEDFHFPGTSRLLRLTDAHPDVLHVHNLHGAYFDLRKLPQLSRQVLVMLTLHDAWLLSGHCAHSFGCERWKTGCGHCPDLTIYPAVERDATAYNWRRKRDIFARSQFYVATPSRWLMRKVEQSMLAPAVREARVVPNGVDLNTFHPSDKQEARAKVGIPRDAKVLLAVGVSIRESIWRDFVTLREVLARLSEHHQEQDVLLIALGEDGPAERYGRGEIRFLRFREDAAEVAHYYQAADVCVHSARVDTFPVSVLESLACGTPVVATAVGGIPEQVEDSRTGFLVPSGDAEGMATRITQLLQNGDRMRSMRQEAAESARGRFGLDRQVEAYLDWYHELLGHGTRRS